MPKPSAYLTGIQYRHVTTCSACGRTHWMIFHRLERPAVIGGRVYDLVGLCPRKIIEAYLREEVELDATN